MSEKYKIYLPSSMRRSLVNDAELFEFLKTDGSVNLNAFLKTLIVNFFDIYRDREMRINEQIITEIRDASKSVEFDIEDLAWRIRRIVTEIEENNVDNDSAITLTVSGESQRVINIIENHFLLKMGLSEYLRCMISVYLSSPRNEREKIIFSTQYDEIFFAIQKQRQIDFTTTTLPEKRYHIYPYMIVPSKQEQSNYLICYDSERCVTRSFRLSRIRNVYTSTKSFTLSDEAIATLEMAREKGPQFAFDSVPEECVWLSEEGIRKFRMIYTNRPEVIRTEGNKYYFKWPLVQLEEYFKRFGKDAIILEPIESKRNIADFYNSAFIAYTKENN